MIIKFFRITNQQSTINNQQSTTNNNQNEKSNSSLSRRTFPVTNKCDSSKKQKEKTQYHFHHVR